MQSEETQVEVEVKVKKRRASRKPYCLPCKARRVKCSMERPVCVRCQRQTRTHECIYEDERPAKSSILSDTTALSLSPASSSKSSSATLELDTEVFTPVNIIDSSLENAQYTRNQYSGLTESSTVSSMVELPDSLACIAKRKSEVEERNVLFESHAASLQRFSTIEKAYQWQALRHRLHIDSDFVFKSAFHKDWLPRNSILAFSDLWGSSLPVVEKSMPTVESAIKAIGALQLDCKYDAASQYADCLHGLRYRLKNDETMHTVASLETCATILFLLCYELLNGADLSNFERHLIGVSQMLRQQVQYILDGGDPIPFRTDFALLLYRSYRSIEITEACLQHKVPRLQLSEWNILLPIDLCFDQEDVEFHLVFEFMNLTSSMTANGIQVTETELASLHQRMTRTFKSFRYTATISETIPEADSLDFFALGSAKSPFQTNLHVPGADGREAIHRNSVTALLLTTRLHLELYMATTTQGQLTTSAETLVRLVQHMVTLSESCKTARGRNLPWALYALAIAGRAFDREGVTDERREWTKLFLTANYRAMIS